MQASATEINQKEVRRKEYQRQQERLKAMATNSEKMKSVSADAMIENLLKQSFVKSNSVTAESKPNCGMDLPNWLESESPRVPEAYKYLWSLVKTSTNFADTQKVSQLLLTSGLQMEVLGFIWNISNKIVPGHLNKQEFYIVLALVGLAQSGYPFNNASVLNLLPNAPIPTLEVKVLDKYLTHPVSVNCSYFNDLGEAKSFNENIFKSFHITTSRNSDYPELNNPVASLVSNLNESTKNIVETKAAQQPFKVSHTRESCDLDNPMKDQFKASNFPYIGSSPTAELEDEDDFSEFHSVSMVNTDKESKTHADDSILSSQSDEFTDFQCADIAPDPLETVIISQRKEIPKIPLPHNLTGKLSNLRTNILKISSEGEKKLKVLSQSEMFSSLPESKISTNNKVSAMPNISVLGSNRDIGMRLAHHSLGSKMEKPKHKYKEPVQMEDVLFTSKFGAVDELFPKCFQKSGSNLKTFVLKETKISVETMVSESTIINESSTISNLLHSSKNTRKIEIPMLGTFNETTLPTHLVKQQPVQLFSVEEDKYSALREVELEMKKEQKFLNEDKSGAVDEFGEFLSADLPSSAPSDEKDLWGEWNDSNDVPYSLPQESTLIEKTSQLENTKEVITRSEGKYDNDISDLSFDLLNLNEPDKEDRSSPLLSGKTEDEKNDGAESIANDFVIPIYEFDSIKENQNCENIVTLNPADIRDRLGHSNEDYGDFFTTNFDSTTAEAPNEGLFLPNLDLKTSRSDIGDQENTRKKCMVACLNMMQQAVDTFSGVSTKAVLEEIFQTQEAIDYLNNLNVMYQISRRIYANHGDVSYFQVDIEKIWQELINYCCEYKIQLKEDVDNNGEEGTQCNLCCGCIGKESISQGIASFHPSCANFWINFIDSDLPCSV